MAKSKKDDAKIYVEDGIFRRKPGGPLYVRWFDENGRDRSRSTKGTEITTARILLRKCKEDARLRAMGLKLSEEDEAKKDITLSELIEQYRAHHESGSSRVPNRGYMKRWKSALGSKKVAKITTGDIENWRREASLSGLTNATLNRHTSFLRSLFYLAIRDRIVDFNPCGKGRLKPLEEGPGRDRVIEPEEEELIIPRLGPVDRAGFVICLYTGLRQGELLKLKREDVDFKKNQLILRKTKAKKVQTAVMNTIVTDAVRFLLQSHPHPYLMPGIRDPQGQMGGVKLTKRLEAVCEELGLPPGINWHSTRHTYLTRLDEIGASTNYVKSLARHSTVRVTERYMHSNKAQMEVISENLVVQFTNDRPNFFPERTAQKSHLRVV